MEFTPGMRELTERCKLLYSDAESVIHRWGHIMRTARGAVWFVNLSGGSERDQQLAYVAGILHDGVRPVTEETCHAHASAEWALILLEAYSEFSDEETQSICQAIQDHRMPAVWKSPVHQSVFLSDKILEHMGAYLDFRAPVWAGELSYTDLHGLEPVEAVICYYRNASRKFCAGNFPDFVHDLVEYQTHWNRVFLEALIAHEPWAVDMAEYLFSAGSKKKNFDWILASFSPHGSQQEKWSSEMNAYITGKKFRHFQEVLSSS